MNKVVFILLAVVSLHGCGSGGGSDSRSTPVVHEPVPTEPQEPATIEIDPLWRNASVYFLLPDRFYNGDTSNDFPYTRQDDSAYMRGFMGGDLRGVIDKLNEGYFTDLGITAIWMSPVMENIHGYDESSGRTYAYHGYWPKDWTRIDANFGSEADLKELIDTAHAQGIRILLDVIANHTGPVTSQDEQWPSSWVRTQPVCDWSNFAGNVTCALTDHLPDIRTESDTAVELPQQLQDKWQNEGRLASEQAELDAFFSATGHPRVPKYFLLKWLTDWVREYGVDGFRVDTAKHVEPEFWAELKQQSNNALAEWKAANPDKAIDQREFFMVGEVYGFGVDNFGGANGRQYDFGDRQVDFYSYGFDSLINMGFVHHVSGDIESLFSLYSQNLNDGALKGVGVLSYLSSHDDYDSFDRERQQITDSASKLMLAPGAAQIYYGDELARPLIDSQALYDAALRLPMNWDDLQNQSTQDLLAHWQKLGQFRRAHLAVGAGDHKKLQDSPYIFSRELVSEKYPDLNDKIIVGMDMPIGEKAVPVFDLFAEGSRVKDYYSGTEAEVVGGQLVFDSEFEMLLLGVAQ